MHYVIRCITIQTYKLVMAFLECLSFEQFVGTAQLKNRKLSAPFFISYPSRGRMVIFPLDGSIPSCARHCASLSACRDANSCARSNGAMSDERRRERDKRNSTFHLAVLPLVGFPPSHQCRFEAVRGAAEQEGLGKAARAVAVLFTLMMRGMESTKFIQMRGAR